MTGADGTKLEGGAAMTSSNPVYKRRRLDLAAPATAEAAAAPQTPPALVAFPGGGVPMPRPTRGSLTGTPLAGSVDAEFDMGYFVTITAGGQEFKGALQPPMLARPKSLHVKQSTQLSTQNNLARQIQSLITLCSGCQGFAFSLRQYESEKVPSEMRLSEQCTSMLA